MKIMEDTTLEKLKSLRALFDELYQLKDNITDVFKRQIVLSVFFNFFEAVFAAFVNIVMFQTKDDYFKISLQNIMVKVAAAGLTIKLFILTYVCDYTYNKAKEVGVTVNRLYPKFEDEKVKQEVS